MEPRDSTGLPLSVAYVKTEAKRLHPLFSGDVSYDRINDEFVPPQTLRPEPNLVKADLSDLQQALGTYQRVQEARGLAGTPLDFKDPADCTWDDIFKQLDDVKLRREYNEKQGLGYLRKLWRELGQRAEKIDPWLDLIPDEHGLGFVRMGIFVVLQLAKRSSDSYNEMAGKMVEIIDAVTMARPRRRNIFWDDELASMVKALYVSVLEAVATMVQFLLQKVERVNIVDRVSRSTIGNFKKLGSRNQEAPRLTHNQPKLSQEDVNDKVSEVTDGASKFIEAYRLKMDGIIIDTRLVQDDLMTVAQASNALSVQVNSRLQADLPTLKSQNKELLLHASRSTSDLHDIKNSVSDLPQLLRPAIESLTDQNIQSVKKLEQSIMDKFSRFMFEAEKSNQLRDLLRMQAYQVACLMEENKQLRSQSPAPGIPVLNFVASMGIPPTLAQEDLNSLLGEQELFSMDDEATQAVETLMKQDYFIHWQYSPGSSSLLVDGNDEKRATESVSAMTLLSVSIIGSLKLRQYPQTVVLYYFCGKHTGQHEGPWLLMRSLIVQLLLVMHNNRYASSLPFSLNDEELRAGDMNALITLFERLLRILPREVTVYCIIDGVAWYENNHYGFTPSMIHLTRKLSELAWPQQQAYHYNVPGRNSMRTSFKVMLTSANGTRYIRRELGYSTHCVDVSVGDWEMDKGSY